MGVLSNRVDIKAAAAAAERSLERMAEPLAALWLPPISGRAGLLDDAWLAVIRNSAHDSVCGCSADQVGRAVIHRYDQAGTLAREVVDRAMALAEVATVAPGPVVVNPSGPRQVRAGRNGSLRHRGPGRDPGGRGHARRGRGARRAPVADLARHARRAGPRRLAGWHRTAVEARIEKGGGDSTGGRGGETSGGGGLTVVLTEDAASAPAPAMASVMAEAWAQAGAGASERYGTGGAPPVTDGSWRAPDRCPATAGRRGRPVDRPVKQPLPGRTGSKTSTSGWRWTGRPGRWP